MSSDAQNIGMSADHVEGQIATLSSYGSTLYEISGRINTSVAEDWEPNLANLGADALHAAKLMVTKGPVVTVLGYGAYMAEKRLAAEMAMNAAMDISNAAGQLFDLLLLLRAHVTDQRQASSDSEGYAEPAMSKAQADALYDRAIDNPGVLANMTPQQVAAWWRRLSPGQREEFIAKQHWVAGNTNGIPFEARMQANEINAREYLQGHPELGDDAKAYLAKVTSEFVDVAPRDGLNDDGAVRLISFDPDENRIIEVVGDLNDDTRNIINYVPGTGADVAGFYSGETQRMAERLVDGHPDRVAFVWKDSIFPTFNPGDTAVSGNVWAANVGSRYAEFNAALGLENSGHLPVMSIEHSFGSAVGGYAETSGSHFSSRVVLGGAGMTDDWKPQDGTEYVALIADHDVIRNIHDKYLPDYDMGYEKAPDASNGFREVEPGVIRVHHDDNPISDRLEGLIYEHRDVADPDRNTGVVPTIDDQLERDRAKAVAGREDR